MGCGASMSNRDPQPGVFSSKAEVPSQARSYPSPQPLLKKNASGSHATSIATQTHVATMRNAASLRAEPMPDGLGQICDPVKDGATSAGSTFNRRSSSRLSLAQLRQNTISHNMLISVRAPSNGQLRNSIASQSEREVGQDEAEDAATATAVRPQSSSTRSVLEHTHQQQQQREQRQPEEKQHRLCEHSTARSSSLHEVADSPSATTAATARMEQRSTRRSPPLTAQRTKSPTSTQDPLPAPKVHFGFPRSSISPIGSSQANNNNNNNADSNRDKRKSSPPQFPLPPANVAQTSVLDIEYSGVGSNFDINSSEDDGDGDGDDVDVDDAANRLRLVHSTQTPTPDAEKFGVSSRGDVPRPPAATSSPLPAAAASSSIGGSLRANSVGGGFRLQPITDSASLVSFAGAADDLFVASSQHSNEVDRLDSVSPVIGGLTSRNYSRPTSGGLGSTSHFGRVDQAATNGLATFFNQPRECANCRSPAVAFACEACDDFFLCEDCRFNVEAVRAMHDPTHAMLSIQETRCGSSRTFGGDSIFSLSGEGGASSLFNPPCSRCARVIDDTEPVYRCEQCDYVVCLECFFTPPEAVVLDSDSPHEHVLKRFQRKSKPTSVHEGAVVSKSRNRGGNRVINDYVVVRLLGRGSYAKVKLVQHIRTQELFALKILKKQKKALTNTVNLGRSRVKMANAGVSEDDLLREIAVMKFIDHPNVMNLKEVIEDVEAQKVYVIMEYCEKGPVHVLDSPPLALQQVQQYGADILRGLLHLHSEFLYHRDIKPANCLVNHDFVVKIADFGTCNSQIRSKTSEGTVAFSCPEQVRGEEVSGEVVDSWAFALTLYEMAFGTLPVSTTSMLQHRNMLLGPDPIPIPEGGDPQLRNLLTAMLTKQLKKRMLLAAAAQHPFFEAFHIDPHGTPYNTTQLATSKQEQRQQQQEQTVQHDTLTELYDKALGSVHRGKNLKDCFHGVRAVRRIRRKEAEMARQGSDGGAPDDYDEGERASYLYDEDGEDVSGVQQSRGTDLRSPARSPTGYGYGSSGDSASVNSEAGDVLERHLGNRSVSTNEEEAAAAARDIEEVVHHHLSSNETRVEVSYVALTRQTTLEKLNQLSGKSVELRLAHNLLASVVGLRFSAFHALKEISISFNRLDAFPEEVLAAPRLIRLDLSHNRIASIPSSLVTNAPFLERLNLHHNFITQVGTVLLTSPRLPPSHVRPSAGNESIKGTWAAPYATTSTATPESKGSASPTAADVTVLSVLAAPCLRHVRLSGNPLESLPLALETTHRLELVLDAIPALMEQWKEYPLKPASPSAATTVSPTTTTTSVAPGAVSAPAAAPKSAAAAAKAPVYKLPAIIVWDDSFPVRIPDVEPAVWLAVNNMAVYRVQTLRTCRTRRVVLCQCADPRFPNGLFDSADLEAYFAALSEALQARQQSRQQQQQQRRSNGSMSGPGPRSEASNDALPPIVGRVARSFVESYFFVTDDESEEDGGYYSLVDYLNEALAEKEPVLVVVMTHGNASAVRTNIVAALSTCLTLLRGRDPDDVSEQVELVVSTMRSIYS